MPRERYFKYLPSLPYDAFDDSGQKKVVTDIFKRVRATLQARTDNTIEFQFGSSPQQQQQYITNIQ